MSRTTSGHEDERLIPYLTLTVLHFVFHAVVLSAGGVLSLPKRMLDPRRPLVPTAEHKEEGLIPYLPELGIPHQSLINYNQSVSYIIALKM